MVFIFLLSSMPSLKSSFSPTYDFPLRKLAHIGEYAILAFLVLRACEVRITKLQSISVTLIITVLYSMADEWHQTFVPGRHGALQDVMVNIIGMAIGMYTWLRTRRGKLLNETAERPGGR